MTSMYEFSFLKTRWNSFWNAFLPLSCALYFTPTTKYGCHLHTYLFL